MNFESLPGGQFQTAKGGQFESAKGGQLKSAEGGQFGRRLQSLLLKREAPSAIFIKIQNDALRSWSLVVRSNFWVAMVAVMSLQNDLAF